MKNQMHIFMPILLFFLVSCDKEEVVSTDNVDFTANMDIQNLSIEPDVFRISSLPDSITVKMFNNTNEIITVGLQYSIEVYEDHMWKEVSPKDMVFYDIGFDLKPSEFKYFKKSLLKHHINYAPGKYRIVKYYLMADYQETKEKYHVYAEFYIGKG